MVHGGATLPDGQFLADEPTMAAKEALAVWQKRSIAQAAADLIRAEDFIYIDAGTTTLAMVRALRGPALEAHNVTNGIANARLLAAQREQARAADRRLEQEQTRQRREAEKTRIEADKARQTEDARRRRREYAANQIKLAKNQQSKDYWESEWKRNL